MTATHAAGLDLSIAYTATGYALVAKGPNVAYVHVERAANAADLEPNLRFLAAMLERPSDLDNEMWVRTAR